MHTVAITAENLRQEALKELAIAVVTEDGLR